MHSHSKQNYKFAEKLKYISVLIYNKVPILFVNGFITEYLSKMIFGKNHH